MKKFLLLLSIIIVLQSCKNDNQEVERLREENELLKSQVQEKEVIDEPLAETKFVWTVINFKKGDLEGYSGGLRMVNVKKDKIWSDINEVQGFDRTLELKLQDVLENELRDKHTQFVHSIQKGETFVFDTYEEASEFKFKTLN